jgi:outer membrane protein OmpA-like peptidoglycan-associated protein
MRRGLCLLLLAALVACGGNGEASTDRAAKPSADSEPSPPPAEAVSASRPLEWPDPEPPEAQALAEAVVHAAFNEDKTTRLGMKILPLVDRTSGIEGFESRLAARDIPLDERLERLDATVRGQEIVIRLSGSVLFDFDRADIRSDAERTLGEVAAVLAAYQKRRVRIEGHTDAIASDAYNQTLSERRAQAVKGWLAAHGVPEGRMTAVGHGESQPVADNGTPEGRQRNRRVEIVIEPGG